MSAASESPKKDNVASPAQRKPKPVTSALENVAPVDYEGCGGVVWAMLKKQQIFWPAIHITDTASVPVHSSPSKKANDEVPVLPLGYRENPYVPNFEIMLFILNQS